MFLEVGGFEVVFLGSGIGLSNFKILVMSLPFLLPVKLLSKG